VFIFQSIFTILICGLWEVAILFFTILVWFVFFSHFIIWDRRSYLYLECFCSACLTNFYNPLYKRQIEYSAFQCFMQLSGLPAFLLFKQLPTFSYIFLENSYYSYFFVNKVHKKVKVWSLWSFYLIKSVKMQQSPSLISHFQGKVVLPHFNFDWVKTCTVFLIAVSNTVSNSVMMHA